MEVNQNLPEKKGVLRNKKIVFAIVVALILLLCTCVVSVAGGYYLVTKNDKENIKTEDRKDDEEEIDDSDANEGDDDNENDDENNKGAEDNISLSGNEEEQKEFFQGAATAFSQQEEFSMWAKGKLSGEDMEMKMYFDGNSMEIYMKSVAMSMELSIIIIDEYSYIGMDGDWVRMKKEDADDIIDAFNDMQSLVEDELFDELDTMWAEGRIEYLGSEMKEGEYYEKFLVEEIDEESMYVWIEKDSKLLRYLESTQESKNQLTISFSYEAIEIEAPEEYEDLVGLPEEEQNKKITDLFF